MLGEESGVFQFGSGQGGTWFKRSTAGQNECTILLVLEVKKEIST
jgi:hypothetical protein